MIVFTQLDTTSRSIANTRRLIISGDYDDDTVMLCGIPVLD